MSSFRPNAYSYVYSSDSVESILGIFLTLTLYVTTYLLVIVFSVNKQMTESFDHILLAF